MTGNPDRSLTIAGLFAAIFSDVVSNDVRITRNVSLNSPPRLGGVAAPSIKCREASLAGADGVVDPCCEAS